jgi:hypothetical protein
MALKKEYKQANGVAVTGYYRVREVHTQYEKDKGSDADQGVNFQVEVFNAESGERINEPESFLEMGIGSYDMALDEAVGVTGLVDQAYKHLKSLELFWGAEDC